MGTIYWKELTNDEFEELRRTRNEQLENGEIQEPSCRTRSDKGKKRTRGHLSEDLPRHKKYKTAEIIHDEDEDGPHENTTHQDIQEPEATALTNTGADTSGQTATGVNANPATQPSITTNPAMASTISAQTSVSTKMITLGADSKLNMPYSLPSLALSPQMPSARQLLRAQKLTCRLPQVQTPAMQYRLPTSPAMRMPHRAPRVQIPAPPLLP